MQSGAVPRVLHAASCMAENAACFARDVVAYVATRIGHTIDFVDDVPWHEREQRLHAGTIHLCWICGLPYVREHGRGDPGIEVLAAPVMAAPRYGRAPVYFSEVVVRAEIEACSLDDLDGLRIAYNEPNSHSGYNVLCDALARKGAPRDMFRMVIESGAHQVSLQMLLAGEADVAVIDSTVLETEFEHRADTATRVRSVDTLGPSPMPPWVVTRTLPDALKAELLGVLSDMHLDPFGAVILARARVERFARVDDAWYDPIRAMANRASAYPLRATHYAMPMGTGYAVCPA